MKIVPNTKQLLALVAVSIWATSASAQEGPFSINWQNPSEVRVVNNSSHPVTLRMSAWGWVVNDVTAAEDVSESPLTTVVVEAGTTYSAAAEFVIKECIDC